MQIDGLFGLFSVACGIYCLYGYYMAHFRTQIVVSLLLPKDVNLKKCKDYRGYCNAVKHPLLALGIVVVLYGAVDFYNSYKGVATALYIAALSLMVATLIIFVIHIRKINRKYFGI